jgi:hypothetical protein
VSDRINHVGVLDDTLRTIVAFAPKLLAFVAILAVGWIAARILQKIACATLSRIGFRRAVERGGIHRVLARSRYDATDIVGKIVYYGVFLVTFQVAFGVWGPNPVSDLIKGVVAWLPQAVVAIVIVVVTAAIARAVGDIVGTALSGYSYGRLVAGIASYSVVGLGLIAALNQVGVAVTVTIPILITALATIGGVLVVGVGGGLVRPMQQRWERLLTRAEAETHQLAEHATAYAAGRNDTATRYVETAGVQATGARTAAPTGARTAAEGGWPNLEDTAEQPITGARGSHAV